MTTVQNVRYEVQCCLLENNFSLYFCLLTQSFLLTFLGWDVGFHEKSSCESSKVLVEVIVTQTDNSKSYIYRD